MIIRNNNNYDLKNIMFMKYYQNVILIHWLKSVVFHTAYVKDVNLLQQSEINQYRFYLRI